MQHPGSSVGDGGPLTTEAPHVPALLTLRFSLVRWLVRAAERLFLVALPPSIGFFSLASVISSDPKQWNGLEGRVVATDRKDSPSVSECKAAVMCRISFVGNQVMTMCTASASDSTHMKLSPKKDPRGPRKCGRRKHQVEVLPPQSRGRQFVPPR